MTDVLKICAAALVVAVSGFLLREMGWRGAVAFSVLSAVVFFSFLSDGLSRLGASVSALAKLGGVGTVAKEILKLTGVSYVFGVCSDICADLGEKTVSSALEVVGRVEILLICMPYFIKIAEYAVGLVG